MYTRALAVCVGLCACSGPEPTSPGSETGADTGTGLPEGVHLVEVQTTVGPLVFELHEDWAPLGVERVLELVDAGYYDDTRFFRVVPDFMVQFGLSGDPATTAQWAGDALADDPVEASNTRGMISFATAGPNTRTTQLFINFVDNSFLDAQGFAPIGRVSQGMERVDQIYEGYGEMPQQPQITSQGNAYLDGSFPDLDGIVTAARR